VARNRFLLAGNTFLGAGNLFLATMNICLVTGNKFLVPKNIVLVKRTVCIVDAQIWLPQIDFIDNMSFLWQKSDLFGKNYILFGKKYMSCQKACWVKVWMPWQKKFGPSGKNCRMVHTYLEVGHL
jgi:hypothetical protein